MMEAKSILLLVPEYNTNAKGEFSAYIKFY